MKREFIVERQGKSFVLYAGLLDLAHQQGLKSVRTELVQTPSDANQRVAICTATVVIEQNGLERVFTGIGDAAANNVAPAMQTCLIRMAETRAKARALRDAVNVGVAAIEELGVEGAHDGAPERGYAIRSRRSERPAAARTVQEEQPRQAPVAAARQSKPDADAASGGITEAQTRAVMSLCRARGHDADQLARDRFQADALAALTESQASDLIRGLNERSQVRLTSAA